MRQYKIIINNKVDVRDKIPARGFRRRVRRVVARLGGPTNVYGVCALTRNGRRDVSWSLGWRAVVIIALLIMIPAGALADELPGRVAALEREADELRSIITHAKALLAIVGIGGIAAIWSGARWVRAQVRSVFARSLADVGLDLPTLTRAAQREEIAVRHRRHAQIVVVAPDGRRDVQLALQNEKFDKVTVHMPGTEAAKAVVGADLVVLDGWGEWAEHLVRDLGRDDVLVYSGPVRVEVPRDLSTRIMLANTPLTLALHSAALLARADARRATAIV